MIRRIRELMAAPFARPPGRPSAHAAYAPEYCAAGTCAVFVFAVLAGAVMHDRLDRSAGETLQAALLVGAAAAYGFAGLLLLILPVIFAARGLARERDLGTAEALLLTPLDHRRTAWGRFWRAFLPWWRFSLYLLPLYVLGALSVASKALCGIDRWIVAPFILILPKPMIMIAGFGAAHEGMSWGAWTLAGLLVAALRFIKDLSVLAMLAAIAFWVSSWARGSGRALAWSFVIGLGWLCSLGALHLWSGLFWARAFGFGLDNYSACVVALIVGLAVVAAQFVLSLVLVGRAARRFEAWSLREDGV